MYKIRLVRSITTITVNRPTCQFGGQAGQVCIYNCIAPSPVFGILQTREAEESRLNPAVRSLVNPLLMPVSTFVHLCVESVKPATMEGVVTQRSRCADHGIGSGTVRRNPDFGFQAEAEFKRPTGWL